MAQQQATMRAGGQQWHLQCRQILDDRYKRLDRLFDRAVNMDDTREKTLKYLIDEADALLDENNGAVLQNTKAWLDEFWG